MQKWVIPALLFCFGLPAVISPTYMHSQQEESGRTRRVISRVVPQYPELARSMRIEGTVKMLVAVATNGRPTSTKIIGGHPLLAQAAEGAIEKWRWTPTTEETREHRNFFALLSGGSLTTGSTQTRPINDSTEEPEVHFVSFVLDDTQRTWTQIKAN